jgi:ParB-like chromosome segregation protein Spo0J
MAAWRNRIVGYGEEKPDQLLANPRNWRIHPKGQQDALSGVFRDVGIVQNVIVNKRTGFVVDGHLRVSLAISHNQPSIPVTYVDLDEAEEAEILATLDPLGAMAAADKEKLNELLQEVQSGEEGVQAMLAALVGDLPDQDRELEEIDMEQLPVKPLWCLMAIPFDKAGEAREILRQVEALGIRVEYGTA